MKYQEIRINKSGVEKKLDEIGIKKNQLPIGKAGSYSSSSIAMEEFVNSFDELSEILNTYIRALEMDLNRIRNAIGVVQRVDVNIGYRLLK